MARYGVKSTNKEFHSEANLYRSCTHIPLATKREDEMGQWRRKRAAAFGNMVAEWSLNHAKVQEIICWESLTTFLLLIYTCSNRKC